MRSTPKHPELLSCTNIALLFIWLYPSDIPIVTGVINTAEDGLSIPQGIKF